MSNYPFTEIEKKWQDYWDKNETFKVTEDPTVPPEKRKYVLDMFPYPSAAGLHVGHPEGYTATDIYCRFLTSRGYHVLHPMGFDSFGLAAETYAIKMGTHPLKTTEDNIDRFRKQIKSLGFCYDWSREIATHTPQYYKWTQWIFLQLYKKGLAYSAEIPVWYCPEMGTVLANEEVLQTPEGPRSERGNHPVERRPLRQWMLRITAYAERLLADLEGLDWPESIKAMQRNWIGKSEGAHVGFQTAEGGHKIEVFTTRPDTLFGATYMVLAPEHPLVAALVTPAQKSEVETYVHQAKNKSDMERTELNKDKTGVFTGAYAVNPVNGAKIPIWISDYVMMNYGTGAIMAVPGHDERDWAFAKKFGLPILRVVSEDGSKAPLEAPFTGEGISVDSGEFSGLTSSQAKKAVTQWLEAQGLGAKTIQYKLRDWIFSRQRYWGEPIPLVHGVTSGIIPLPEDSLPLTLPQVANYKPTGTGESPLAAITDWLETTVPGTDEKALRETNTMPQWAGSCWYYLRYIDPTNDLELASPEKINYWMPVDLYVGGAEHAVLHLLYARFWHKVLYDIGVVNTVEPFQRLVNQGMILGENGIKMSKSLGNVINPDDIVKEFGADSMRLYEMFMGPLTASKPWSTSGISGVCRFLNRVWRVSEKPLDDSQPTKAQLKILHKTIQKVTEGTDKLEFNTAIAQMMIFINEVYAAETLPRSLWKTFVILLAPYAPHMGEELWNLLGEKKTVSKAPWPSFDPLLTADDVVTVVIQINGKLRSKMEVAAGLPVSELEALAWKDERVAELTQGLTTVKVITVPDKLVNIVVK